MGLAFKGVANGKGCIRWRGQSVGRRKLRANVATRVAGNQGVVFQPHQESFFQVTTERLADMPSSARLEARNPP